MSTRTETFRRHVTAAAGIYSRIDHDQLTGRNSQSTLDTLEHHVTGAAAVLRDACQDETETLPEYLDGRGARLAARWAIIERRYFLGAR